MGKQHQDDPSTGVALRTREEQRTRRPRMFRVLLHNDDYTPMEFVVRLLQTLFQRTESESTAIMLRVHNDGVGVAGVYTREISETKVAQVHMVARQSECPLMASMQPDDTQDENDAES
ncbi:MAG: ATP-dependent Clp protease adapter ClpS [Nannocystaceae bacterium]